MTALPTDWLYPPPGEWTLADVLETDVPMSGADVPTLHVDHLTAGVERAPGYREIGRYAGACHPRGSFPLHLDLSRLD